MVEFSTSPISIGIFYLIGFYSQREMKNGPRKNGQNGNEQCPHKRVHKIKGLHCKFLTKFLY